jgi:hypothetical protein
MGGGILASIPRLAERDRIAGGADIPAEGILAEDIPGAVIPEGGIRGDDSHRRINGRVGMKTGPRRRMKLSS